VKFQRHLDLADGARAVVLQRAEDEGHLLVQKIFGSRDLRLQDLDVGDVLNLLRTHGQRNLGRPDRLRRVEESPIEHAGEQQHGNAADRQNQRRIAVLFLTASILSFWAGFVTGKVLAWKRGGFIEYSSAIGGVTLYTVFLPWFALMMIWLFAVQLHWLPTGKFLDPVKWLGVDFSANEIFLRLISSVFVAVVIALVGVLLSNRVDRRYRLPLRLVSVVLPLLGVLQYWAASGQAVWAMDIASHTVLPVLTLTLVAYGGEMLLTRTSMLETLREDYILTARAKGLPDRAIRDRHAARTALLPVWTGLVFSIGGSVSGGIITESIFSWPGLGSTLLDSAANADIPVALGCLTVVGVITLFSHLVADIGYAFIDPRIRYA